MSQTTIPGVATGLAPGEVKTLYHDEDEQVVLTARKVPGSVGNPRLYFSLYILVGGERRWVCDFTDYHQAQSVTRRLGGVLQEGANCR